MTGNDSTDKTHLLGKLTITAAAKIIDGLGSILYARLSIAGEVLSTRTDRRVTFLRANSVVWITIVNFESAKIIGYALQWAVYFVDLFRTEELGTKAGVLGRVVAWIVINTATSKIFGSTRVGIFALVEIRTFKDTITSQTVRLKAQAVIAPWS
jgi:hypothetical protein